MVKSKAPPVRVSYHWLNGAARYGDLMIGSPATTLQPTGTANPWTAGAEGVGSVPFAGSARKV
jgi:hypothetical protein